jgi:2-polyprenyl-6-methoxyphenol hydroxylase-like FAD-dependent oxidoreductase
MSEIVIVGAGIAGLGAALALGRRGRHVTLCERDAAPVPAQPEQMWTTWSRPGVAQARLGHVFVPRFATLLRDRAPDVLQRLWDAGAPAWDCTVGLPGQERLPEDADLQGIFCRRPVLEGLLRQAVEVEPTVEVRAGCRVAGLLATASPPRGIPRVVGVRTGDGAALRGDTVVMAGGRQLPVRTWLAAIGVPAPEEVAEGTGLLWYGRCFRLRPRYGEDGMAPAPQVLLSDLGYMVVDICVGDHGTFIVDLAVPHWDAELRDVHREATFMAVARSIPAIAPWIAPERSTPIGSVAAMGQERNILRRFVRAGHPMALGLHVIGDARCQTHNIYGWGASLALAEAVMLADIMAEHAHDPLAQALVFERRIADEVAGWHRLAMERDRARLRAHRGEPPGDAATADGDDGYIQAIVGPAAGEDATVFRAFTRQWTQLDPPGALAHNMEVLRRARALAAVRQPPAAPEPPLGPAREELLQIIAGARPDEPGHYPPV